MADIPRHYVVVRGDLPLAQQVVQVAHACRLAGATFGVPGYAHLTMRAVPDEAALLATVAALDLAGIRHYTMHEPDLPGHTALCTEARVGEWPKPVKRLPFWAAPQ